MIAGFVAAIVLCGIATRLLVTGVAYGALQHVRRPALRAVWLTALVWVAAIALLATLAVIR